VQPFGGGAANSFQIILSDTGGGVDLEVIYEDINWTTASGQNAVTGITDGASQAWPWDGSGNATELLAYEANDFGGGDPVGTYTRSFDRGFSEDIRVDGTSGNDTIALGYLDPQGNQVTTGDDAIFGASGNDSIDGSSGNDLVFGGLGNDTITGGDGGAISYIDVNNGDDLVGTTSQDAYRFAGNPGEFATIRFNNSPNAGDGDGIADFAQITNTNAFDTLTIGVGGNDSIIGTGGFDTIYGGDGNDTIEGGEGNDFLATGLGDDTLFGGAGNDTLINSDGDDVLFGGTGDDTLTATGGNDTLIGGTGDDTMSGGNDADTFIIEDDFGNDDSHSQL